MFAVLESPFARLAGLLPSPSSIDFLLAFAGEAWLVPNALNGVELCAVEFSLGVSAFSVGILNGRAFLVATASSVSPDALRFEPTEAPRVARTRM
jgi:hypothetical protein